MASQPRACMGHRLSARYARSEPTVECAQGQAQGQGWLCRLGAAVRTWPGLGVGLGLRAELGLGLRLGLERLVHTLEPDRVLERRTHEGDAR